MAYTQAEFQPGPSLNLLVGPNGSGKSSFVCAVCIGLGGSPKLLGRGSQEKSFIKRGFESCKTEITLSLGNNKCVLIQRQIKLDQVNKDNEEGMCISQWQIDGQNSSQKKVSELVKSLNIQLNNLCQFLPQDKVQDFSKMNAKELLESTEKAIEDSQLYDNHQELKQLSQQLQSSQLVLNRTQNDLQYNNDQINSMKRDVVRVQERDKQLKEKEMIEHRIKQQNYTNADKEFKRAKQMRDEQQKEFTQQSNKLKKEQQQCKQIFQDCDNVNQQLGATKMRYEQSKEKRDKYGDKLEDKMYGYYTINTQIQNFSQELEIKQREVQRQDALLTQSRQELQTLLNQQGTQSQDTSQRKSEMRQQLQTLDKQVRTISRQISDDDDRIEEATKFMQRLEDDFQRQSALKDKQLQTLQKEFSYKQGIVEAYHWIDSNRSRFRGTIYGPLLIEISFQNPLHAQMMENHAPNALFLRFIVEYQEDQIALLNEFKGNRAAHNNYIPNITYYKGDYNRELEHPSGAGSDYQQYDIQGTLDEYVECAPIIKHVLKDEARINEAFIGTERSYQRLEDISRNTHISALLTPQTSIRMKVSAYNPNVKTQTHTHIKQMRLLQTTVKDQKVIDSKQRELVQAKQNLSVLIEQKKVYKIQQQDLQQQKQEAEMTMQEISKSEMNFNKLKSKLEAQIKNVQGNLTIQIRQLKQMSDANKLKVEKDSLLQELKEMNDQYIELIKEVDKSLINFQHYLLEADVARLKDEGARIYIDQLEQEVKIKQNTLTVVSRQMDKEKERSTSTQKIWKASENLVQKEDQSFQDFFQELPTRVDELEMMAIRRQSEADSITLSNPDAINDYRILERNITELTQKLQTATTQYEVLKNKTDQIKGPWITQLRDIFTQIDQNFQQNFKDLGNYGEVQLKEFEDNYQDYCVELRVKFRDSESLTVLDRNRHSGGERSVSTILYLIAMQQRTHCPFRVIDEINQGMDQENERKVFKFLVESVNRPNSPQIFLVTPKILPNLHYHNIVTVIQIFSGHTIEQESQFVSMDQVIGSYRMSLSQNQLQVSG